MSPAREAFIEDSLETDIDILTYRFRDFLNKLLPSVTFCNFTISAGLIAYWIYSLHHTTRTIIFAIYIIPAFLHTAIYTLWIREGNPTQEEEKVRRKESPRLELLGGEGTHLVLFLVGVYFLLTDKEHFLYPYVRPIYQGFWDVRSSAQNQAFGLWWATRVFWLSCTTFQKVGHVFVLPYFLYFPVFKLLHDLMTGKYNTIFVTLVEDQLLKISTWPNKQHVSSLQNPDRSSTATTGKRSGSLIELASQEGF